MIDQDVRVQSKITGSEYKCAVSNVMILLLENWRMMALFISNEGRLDYQDSIHPVLLEFFLEAVATCVPMEKKQNMQSSLTRFTLRTRRYHCCSLTGSYIPL
jgi:hypothetical protein